MVNKKNLISKLREKASKVATHKRSLHSEEIEKQKICRMIPGIKEKVVKEIIQEAKDEAKDGSYSLVHKCYYWEFYPRYADDGDDSEILRNKADTYARDYIIPELKKRFGKGLDVEISRGYRSGLEREAHRGDDPDFMSSSECSNSECSNNSHYQIYLLDWEKRA